MNNMWRENGRENGKMGGKIGGNGEEKWGNLILMN
jgi:hypothetical protein